MTVYNIVHHSHSPGVVELNFMQFEHRQLVALSGKSYGFTQKEQDSPRKNIQFIHIAFAQTKKNTLDVLYGTCCSRTGNDRVELVARCCLS